MLLIELSIHQIIFHIIFTIVLVLLYILSNKCSLAENKKNFFQKH